MATAIDLLREAIELGKQESKALTQNDVSLAQELATKRHTLVREAWEVRHGCEQSVYKALLLQLQSMQKFLTTEAKKQKDTSLQRISRSRKSTKQINGYKKVMNYT